jgi:protocatechuate 3,4-dioxygenase beta subunit
VGYTVDIEISDGAPVAQPTTDADGLFSLDHVFDSSGDYTVTASFASTAFYPAAIDVDAGIRIMIPTTLTLEIPNYVKINTEVLIEGELMESQSGVPITGQTIKLYDSNVLINILTTDIDGKYSYSYDFSSLGVYQIRVVFDETDYFRGVTAVDTTQIRVATSLVLDIADIAEVGEAVSYEGYLYDEFGNPIAGQPIDIYLGSKESTAQVVTDIAGDFVLPDSFVISGILEDGLGLPLSGQVIDVLIGDGENLNTLGQITTLNDGAFVLTGIDLRGNVRDQLGNPLADQNVKLGLDQAMLFPRALFITDATGEFSLTNSLGLIGTVTDQSGNALENVVVDLWFADGTTSIPLEQRITDENGSFWLERDITVNGTLLDPLGDPMAYQDIRLWFAVDDRDLLIQTITNAAGYFTIVIDSVQYAREFTETGDYSISAFFPGTIEYLRARDYSTVRIVMPTTISADAPALAKVGTPFIIQGVLKDKDDNPLSGHTVEIFRGPLPTTTIYTLPDSSSYTVSAVTDGETSTLLATLITDDNGQYSYDQVFDVTEEYHLSIRFVYTDYIKGSYRQIVVQISGAPTITLDAIEQAEEYHPLTISGTLVYEFLIPFYNSTIDISIDEIIVGGDGSTSVVPFETLGSIGVDAEGGFSVEYKSVDMVEGNYAVTASFAGSDIYLPAETNFNMLITKADYGISLARIMGIEDYYSGIVAGIAAILGAYIAYVLIRRMRFRLRYMLARFGGTATVDPVLAPTSRKTVARHTALAGLDVEFLGAREPLMDVWGINDALEIVYHLYDRDGFSLTAREIEVSVEHHVVGQIHTDKMGISSIRYTFTTQGMYSINGLFAGDNTYKPVNESKMIRIVDYREEAIRLFESVAGSARRRGAAIREKLTPREIERIIISSFKNVDQKKLDLLMGYSEEALYSSHDFTRKSYIDMLTIYEPIQVFIEET